MLHTDPAAPQHSTFSCAHTHVLTTDCCENSTCTEHTVVVGVVVLRQGCDGRLLATAGKDGTARLWDLRTFQCIGECTGHTDSIGAIAFSSSASMKSGKRGFLFSGSADKTIKLWELPGQCYTPYAAACETFASNGLLVPVCG